MNGTTAACGVAEPAQGGPGAKALKKSPKDPRVMPIAVLALILLAWTIIVSGVKGNPEFVYYALIMGTECGCLLWMNCRVRIPTWLLVLLFIWAALHVCGGLMTIPERFSDIREEAFQPTLYTLRFRGFPRYDQVVHTYGFLVASLTAWNGLRAILSKSAGCAAAWFLVALCGMGLGAMNEVLEFIGTMLFDNTGVGGYANTGWDLVSNTIGASLGGAFAVLDWRRRKNAEPDKKAF